MNHLKGPDGVRRQIALGARIHPYKIVRNVTDNNSAETKEKMQPLKMVPLVPVQDVRAAGLCN